MFLELLVLSVCLGGRGIGCNQCLSAYYQNNPHLQEIVSNLENKGKYYIRNNEWVLYAVTPIYTVVSGETASFLVYENLMLSINPRNTFLGITWTY